jgi:aryl-alcohol dehydrogenase
VPFPTVFGHEGAGVVERVGDAVTEVTPGERVAMSFQSCGHCRSCRGGLPSYCYEFFELNFASTRPADGSSVLSRGGEPVHGHFFGQSSFATHAVANARNVVRLNGSLPLEIAAPLGCGIQTGAGAVLNTLGVPSGASLAVFGAGAVGLAAVMASAIVGCTTVVAVDLRAARLELALELGATHVVDAGSEDAVEAIRRITGAGVDFSLEATGSPQVLRQAVDCLAPLGVCGVIGAPAFGTEVVLDVNTILVAGRTVRGVVEGDSVPQAFLPQLVVFWEAGRFPVERLMTHYDFDRIEEAVRDAESGEAIKPVLRMS